MSAWNADEAEQVAGQILNVSVTLTRLSATRFALTGKAPTSIGGDDLKRLQARLGYLCEIHFRGDGSFRLVVNGKIEAHP